MFNDKMKELREGVQSRLNPKQQQWALLLGLSVLFMAFMWVMFTIGDKRPPPAPPAADPLGVAAKEKGKSVLAPGQNLRTADIWVASAGKDVEALKRDRDEARRKLESQEKATQDMLVRFEDLQKKVASGQIGKPQVVAAPTLPVPPPVDEAAAGMPAVTALPKLASARTGLPPLPPPPRTAGGGDLPLPTGQPGFAGGMDAPAAPAANTLVRVSMSDGRVATADKPIGDKKGGAAGAGAGEEKSGSTQAHTLDNFLPVSFTKAVLLGGLDAPTGGQSQSNPHPVLLRLEDDAILPNRFRGTVRECFVVGAGFGDLSSERAYIRTERLSCVRTDGVAIEIQIKGSIFGEDGKNGVRGRLVSKQGQALANALVAGVVSGIGSGVQSSFTSTSQSAFGSVSSVEPNKAFEAGVGAGFGKAMDRMAQYYISLAEKMFPIIEVDAGRLVDVVLTEGVVLDQPLSVQAGARNAPANLRNGGSGGGLYSVGAKDDDE